jgi:hypothetical protein
MKRKLAGIIIALALILSLLPARALAAFSDTDGHWAEEAIDRWGEMGIIRGYDGRFCPDDPITRADMAVILDRLMQNQTAADNTYPDLPADAYYKQRCLAAAQRALCWRRTYMVPGLITREKPSSCWGRLGDTGRAAPSRLFRYGGLPLGAGNR